MVQARVLLFVTAAVGLAGGIVWAALPRDASPLAAVGAGRAAVASPIPAPGEWAALERALGEEIRAREALAAEVASLRAALEAGGLALPPGERAPAGGELDATALRDTEAEAETELDADPDGDPAAGHDADAIPYFDPEGLARYGLAAWEVERLRDRYEAAAMRKLQLSARAKREGWAGRPRHSRALQRIDAQLREEIGDDSFDLALWAAGKPNRLRVVRVLHSSPAAQAGVQPGDVIRGYGGAAVFSTRELRIRTRETGAERNVPLELVSGDDDSLDRTFVPGGSPLGVVLEPVRVPPSG